MRAPAQKARRDDVRVSVRQGYRSGTDAPPPEALPLVRLPRREPARKKSDLESSTVIVLLGACAAVTIFDAFLMLRHFL
jgi:hypothetical protein